MTSCLRSSLIVLFSLVSLAAAPLFAASCPQPPDLAPRATDWQGWGNGLENRRHESAGISSTDLASLELTWAFGFPDTGSVVGNPVIQGTLLLIGVDTGTVYALDADTGCEYWTVKAGNGVRTAPALGLIGDQWRVFFGDRGARVYSVDALSGQALWTTKVDDHAAAILTGSPQFLHLDNVASPDRLLVPVSSSEEGIAAVPTYVCCTFRGSLVSLDATTGDVLWQSHTIASPPVAQGDRQFGPSGGAIWSAPTIDLVNQRLFVTTGDAYSSPADIGTDAVISMDLLTGQIRWINQGTADDIWTVVCMTPNASEACGPDQDYGSPGMLLDSQGVRVLVAAQKSGIVRAFSLQGGTVLWQTALVENTTEFGGKVVWGGASDNQRAYFGLGTGGIAAVNLASSAIDWFTPLSPAPEQAAHAGQDGPLAVSADLVFSGGWDGVVRALDSTTGKLLWSYDTAHAFDTVNAVPANGGSMGAAGPIISGKRLFVPTGYVGVKNGLPGNTLLMFSPGR